LFIGINRSVERWVLSSAGTTGSIGELFDEHAALVKEDPQANGPKLEQLREAMARELGSIAFIDHGVDRLLGTTAARVVDHAKASVLVVR